MEKEIFTIVCKKGNDKIIIKSVEAERITVLGIDCFIFKDSQIWNLSHLETGMSISFGYNKEDTIILGEKLLKNDLEPLEKGKELLKSHGIVLPVNM